MELPHLSAYVAVADLGSITRASNTLHLSQPAVSAQIRKLEDSLGVRLFHRAARGMVLTAEGTHLLPHARALLARADALSAIAARLAGRTIGTLRIGVIDCGYELSLPRIIATLTQQNSEVQVELRTATSGTNVSDLYEHRLDAAVVEGTWDDPRLHRVRLGTARAGIIAPPEWADDVLAASLDDLADFPWVGRPQGCSYWAAVDGLWSDPTRRPTSYRVTDSAHHAIALVQAGMGLALADLADSEDAIRDGDVIVRADFSFEVPVWWVVLDTRKNEPLLQRLLQVVQTHKTGTLRYARARPPTLPRD